MSARLRESGGRCGALLPENRLAPPRLPPAPQRLCRPPFSARLLAARTKRAGNPIGDPSLPRSGLRNVFEPERTRIPERIEGLSHHLRASDCRPPPHIGVGGYPLAGGSFAHLPG